MRSRKILLPAVRESTAAETELGVPPPRPVKLGAPSLYDSRYCALLLQLVDQEGLSPAAFGGFIGVSHDAIADWAVRHPAFGSALKIAENRRQLFFQREARRVVWAGKSANPVAFIWWSKNVAHWRDQLDVNLTVGPSPAELAFKEVN